MAAGTSHSGRDMYVAIGIQGDLGEVATVFTYIQPTAVRGFLEKFAQIKSERRLSTRFRAANYIGPSEVPFGFDAELNPGEVGRILLCAMGTDTPGEVVADHVYDHVFTVAEELPYCTLIASAASVADGSGDAKAIQILDCKISTFAIKGNTDGVMTISVDGTGISRSAIAEPETSFTPLHPFFLNTVESAGLLKIGDSSPGTEFDEVTSFDLTLDNGAKADHRIHNSAVPVGIREGDSGVSGTATAVYNTESFSEIAEWQAGSDRFISLATAKTTAFYTTYYYTLTIAITTARYDDVTPNYDPDIITVNMPFTAEVGDGFSITLREAKAVAYSSAA